MGTEGSHCSVFLNICGERATVISVHTVYRVDCISMVCPTVVGGVDRISAVPWRATLCHCSD